MAAAMSATVFYADPGGNEIATLGNTFKVAGTPTDPTAVSLNVTDPTGAVTAYTYNPGTVTRTSTGAYQQLVPTTIVGVWSYEWVGTGTASDVQAGTWTAHPLTSNQMYATVEELKSRLGIPDTADDFEVTGAVRAACRSIDALCRRYFWRGTDTRTYVPISTYGQQLDDIVSVTSFKVDQDGDGVYEQTWTQGTDYALTVSPGLFNTGAKGETWPYNGFTVIGTSKFIPFVWPWSHLDRIQITGVFGWPSVPVDIREATLIAAADLFRLKDAPFGVAGFGEFGVVRVQANPRVMTLVQRYISAQRVGV
jgi:hypothetical protein